MPAAENAIIDQSPPKPVNAPVVAFCLVFIQVVPAVTEAVSCSGGTVAAALAGAARQAAATDRGKADGTVVHEVLPLDARRADMHSRVFGLRLNLRVILPKPAGSVDLL